MRTPAVHISNASLSYDGINVFSQLSLTLPASKWVGLLGPSGVGKSSLLRMIAGLLNSHEKARVAIHADNHLPVSEQIAYMAQTDLLLPWLTALDNALLGLTLQRSFVMPAQADIQMQREKAVSLFQRVGLSNAMHLYPQQLSGGMRQRAALVRTLMQDKSIILMDEPFSALDAITRFKLQALAADMLRDKTVLFITHDPNEALRLSNDIYIMSGRPVALKQVACLSTATPRDLGDPELVRLQSTLFSQLTEAAGDST